MPLPKKEVKYQIIQEIAVLGPAGKGWTKELNIVSWNGKDPKYDIRDWASGHTNMGKGITLNETEARILCAALTKDLELADAESEKDFPKDDDNFIKAFKALDDDEDIPF